jgi:hypothetical protein
MWEERLQRVVAVGIVEYRITATATADRMAEQAWQWIRSDILRGGAVYGAVIEEHGVGRIRERRGVGIGRAT